MALLMRYVSSPLAAFGISAAQRDAITTNALRFIDERFWGGLASNVIGKAHKTSLKDLVIHVCCSTSDRALFSAGTSQKVQGRTEVSFVEDLATGRFIPDSGYSEVWVDKIAESFRVTLGSDSTATDLDNVGRLMAIGSIHEGMHMKVESFEQVRKRSFDLHKDAFGGIALDDAGIFMSNSLWTTTIKPNTSELIKKHFDRPLKQILRT